MFLSNVHTRSLSKSWTKIDLGWGCVSKGLRIHICRYWLYRRSSDNLSWRLGRRRWYGVSEGRWNKIEANLSLLGRIKCDSVDFCWLLRMCEYSWLYFDRWDHCLRAYWCWLWSRYSVILYSVDDVLYWKGLSARQGMRVGSLTLNTFDGWQLTIQ